MNTTTSKQKSRLSYDFGFLEKTHSTRTYPHHDVLSDRHPEFYENSEALQVANMVFQAEHEVRRVMFVFHKCPLAINEDTENAYVTHSVLPKHMASLCANVFNLAINRYGVKLLKEKSNHTNDLTFEEYLNNTTFIFTHFYGYTDRRALYSEDFSSAMTRFTKNIRNYKPNVIVGFGSELYSVFSILYDLGVYDSTHVEPAQVNGLLIPATPRENNNYKLTAKLTTNIVMCFDISKALLGESTYSYASSLGFAANFILTALLGAEPYSITSGLRTPKDARFYENNKKHKSILVTTIEDFRKVIEEAKQQPCVAIDTETANLNRVKNKLLTIQLGWSCNLGYVIPIQHFETPFSPKELKEIVKTLRAFFEGDNQNDYHIYTNAVFDLNVLRSALKVRFFANDLWDIIAGDFALDENAKFLNSVLGYYRFSLMNLSIAYGSLIYKTASFSKENRATIHSTSLSEDLIEYCALDVMVPYAIHLAQKQRAADIGYTMYDKVVRYQISDMLHCFSCMESHGTMIDVDYLLSLRSKDSPISKEILKLESNILETPECQKAERILRKKQGVPANSLFEAESKTRLLSLRKRDHLHLLFFDVLKLEQPNVGKSGFKKIDKAFQEANSDNKIVKMYSDLTKAKKLSNAYVKQFLGFWQNDDDFRSDRRVRPHYNFATVITGRTSASKPSLQQIPARSTLGKLIKRLFIAPEGKLIIKVDFCLTGSTLVTTSGGLVRLDSLCKGRTVGYTETLQDVYVLGAKGKAPAVSCTYTGFKPTMRITAKSGNSISCTGNHKILVLREGRLQWIEAENCILGDYLCMSSQQMVRETPLTLSLSDPIELNRNNSTGYTNVHKDGNTYFVKIKNGESYDYIRGRFKTAEDAAKARDKYYASHGISGNRSRVELVRPLEMTPDLAYILGCIVSDGYITTHEKHNHLFFYNTDTAFLDRFIQCLFNVFGYQAFRSRIGVKGDTRTLNGVPFTHTKDFWCVRVRSNQIVTWLVELGVYAQYGRKNGKTQSHYQHVPWSILQADKKSQMAFLAAYLEADGGIRNSTHNICWYTTSYKVIRGLRAILNSHGFITSLTGVKRNTKSLHLGRDDSQLLWKEIEPFMVSKKLDAYVGDRTSRLGKLPSKYITYCESKGIDMVKLQKKGYFFTPIIDIRDNGKHHVYDLTVAAGHSPSFTANGIIVHNCAHEVRNWSIVSLDTKVAALFEHGLKLREQYRRNPTKDIAEKIEYEADVHKLNASFFFGVDVKDVTKELRNSVKAVIFGLIYGLGVKKMSGQIKKSKEETLELMELFANRFKVGWSWFSDTKKKAAKKLFVQSPLGRRRNLFNYLVPEGTPTSNSLYGAADRRSVNSIIQGFASDQAAIGARLIERLKWKYFKDHDRLLDIKLNNMVHDSVEIECSYRDFFTALKFIDYALTTGVRRTLNKRCNFDFNVDLDIDFEIGADGRGMEKFDNSYESLLSCLKKALEFQKNELRYDIDVDTALQEVLSHYKEGPVWLTKQIDKQKAQQSI